MRYIFAFVLSLFASPALAEHPFDVQRCVNLDLALEAPEEGAWGYIIQENHINWIANAGFDTIRLPVRFNAYWYGTQLDRGLVRRVDQILGWAENAGLQVILDHHHYDAMMQNPDAEAGTFIAIWAELAERYADRGDWLIFELLNEPFGKLTNERAMQLFNDTIPVIRETNPNRWIVIEGAPVARIDSLPALTRYDEHVALSFHYYIPHTFSHQQATWMKNPPPPRDWGSPGERQLIVDHMKEAASYGLPMFLGEFGVTKQTELRPRLDYITTVREEAEANGIGWCHWGFAGGFPMFDTTINDWSPGMKRALMGE